MPLPTFLLIGAAKAGTTALHAWLAEHPDVCMSRPKETQFFSVGDSSDLRRYEASFAHWDGEVAIGESTPIYLTLPSVPERIARTLPDVRLLAILRDPADQAFSAWWMFRCLGLERRSFDRAIADALAQPPLDAAATDEGWAAIMSGRRRPQPPTFYLLIGCYRSAIERYHATFGAERLTTLLYDDLRKDPTAVAAAVCDAIGVDLARAPSEEPTARNQATGAAEAWARRTASRLPIPRLARRGIVKTARSLDRSGPPTLRPGQRAVLVEYFETVNRGLDDLVGRDLGAWSER